MSRGKLPEGMTAADVRAFWWCVETDGDVSTLCPIALLEGRLYFRDGPGCCGNCGCEILTGRKNGDGGEGGDRYVPRRRASMVDGAIGCAGCGVALRLEKNGAISSEDAARIGLEIAAGIELSPAQDRAIRGIAGGDCRGIRSTTLGALAGAGLIEVCHGVTSATLTAEGVDYLASREGLES